MTPERIERLRNVLNQRQPDLTLVTDFVHKQRNLSALIRVADSVGAMSVHAVLRDEDCQAFRGTFFSGDIRKCVSSAGSTV